MRNYLSDSKTCILSQYCGLYFSLKDINIDIQNQHLFFCYHDSMTAQNSKKSFEQSNTNLQDWKVST